MKGPLPLPTSIASGSSMSSPFLMPSHINPFLQSSTQQCTVTLPPLYHKSGSSAYFSMDTFDSLPPPLDSLDSLTITDFKTGMLLCYLACLIRGLQLILYIKNISWPILNLIVQFVLFSPRKISDYAASPFIQQVIVLYLFIFIIIRYRQHRLCYRLIFYRISYPLTAEQ